MSMSKATPLPQRLRHQMELAFNSDFSDVRILGNSKEAARMRCDAFAVGKNIHMRGGAPLPESAKGRELIAHELAHVIQQKKEKASFVPSARSREIAEAKVQKILKKAFPKKLG